ncbi:MAG: hydrogenase nickel incorporation protein HypA [Elusimicrobia bacterium]|nr:hydrogenase nickel incorporation protein HypA [Elusimicrobiota bacterium]
MSKKCVKQIEMSLVKMIKYKKNRPYEGGKNMHEWALADSVITSAVDFSKKEKLKKISQVNIVFGELQNIDKEIFLFALKELIKSSNKVISSSKFKILNEPAKFNCKVCATNFNLEQIKKSEAEAEYIHFIPEMAHTYLKCPKCKSPDFDIIAGRGVYIKNIIGDS